MTQKSGTLDWDIEEWLENLGMDEYVDIFVDNGYDIPQLVASMTNKDLDAMHIREPEHRRLLLKEAAKIPKDKPPPKPRRTFKFNAKPPDIKVPREGLSRLQLKLKVGAELKNDKLDITAPPYSTADGLADTVALFNLSKKYAGEFKVNIEDTYNAVMDIWKSRTEAEVNFKSVFSPELQTPVTSPSVQGPTENYDEIFTTSLEKKPVRVRGKSSTEKPPNPRPLTPSAAQVSDIQTPNGARPLTPEIQYKKLRRFLESFDKKSHVPGTSPAALFRLDDSEIWNGNGPIPEDVRIDLMTRFCEGELSVDQVVEKVMQHEEKRSGHNLAAFDDNEDPKQTSSEAPLRKNVAIRTTSEESVYNSPKTSLGRSTDSDSSSPSGSPEVTRKKRVWERNGKVKETFMALEDSEESSEDVKKDKNKGKPKFLQKVTKKLFSSRSKSKSTAESNSDKEKDISITRTQSSPAIAGEKNSEVPEDTMANYSQPFDSIVPSTSSSKDSAVRPKGKLPPRYTQKQISTLPHDFSPSNMRKSPSLNEVNTTKTSALNSMSGLRKKPSSEEYAMRSARLNGNLNCSVDSEDAPLRAGSPSSSSHMRDTSSPDTQGEGSSIPDIPPRTYTPPPEEEVPIPPHPDDYYITDNGKDTTRNKLEHGKRSYGGASGRHGVSPPRQVIPVMELSPVKEEGRQEETSSSQPPKKPKRHQRRSGSATSTEEAGKSGGPISTETTITASLPQTNLEHKEQCDEDISMSRPSIPRKPSRLKKLVTQKAAMGESPKKRVSRESPQPEHSDVTSVDPVKKSQPPTVTRQQQVIQKVAMSGSTKTSVSRESPQPEHGDVTSVDPVKKSQPPTVTRQQRVTSPRRTAPPPPVPEKKKTSSVSEQPVSFPSPVPLPRTVTVSDTSGHKLPPRGRVSVTPTDPLLWQQTRSPGSPSLPPKPSKLKYGFRSRSLENVFDSTERDTVDERPSPPPKPIPARPPKSAHLRNLSRPVSEVPASWREQPQANSMESSIASGGNVQAWRTPPPRRLANRQPLPGLPGNLVTKPTIPPKPLFRAKSPSPQQRIEAIAVLEKKLEKERICLSESPYSNINGDCGIPPMMAQRYSRETGLSLDIVEQSLDFIRLNLLQKLDRPATASSKEYWKSTPTVSTTSVNDWLVSIGLPFYKESFSRVQLHSIREIPSITSGHLRALNLLDPSHKEYINEGIKYLLAQIMH